ncbi:aldehyde dehydrogenase [Bacillus sp. 31A1R]|uniref:Aldehyde dehydrogenase n=1 Tax=Robertmurraya mangrovi TaxID=3098077 RepID=A0ABU5J143_9BACI|nr:aldehyde dehydrogenase [Bacillus sp. 31A1R]MDZ5473087.1 aldehyde dehydrogenase [Bacillus sp. 31A1R]
MNHYHTLVNKQKTYFRTGITKDVTYRIDALQRLRDAIRKNEQSFIRALNEDLNKSEFEAYSTEIGVVLEEIRFTLEHLRSWVKPKKVKTPITHVGSNSFIYAEPYGVALVIAPWNYPFQLAIAPLIGAIAAGNCTILKPSELTPKTSEVLGNLIEDLFPEEYVSVVQGGVEASQALLNEKFDYIFFTGSVPVGKIIMEAASKHLTPVTLELGGKSPCIVHEDANIKLAAKRIAWGKFMNAGQTCVAPDYLYLHKKIRNEFLEQFKEITKELYGDKPLNNPNYTRIVSKRHFERLQTFLNNGELFMGGGSNEVGLTIEPTVLTNITWEDSIMQDEIFGPILPVIEYEDLSDVIEGIHNHPNPLALYIFSESESIQRDVLNDVSFGGGCINDTVYHIASPYLPFGGVGSSGTGAYHGKGSFDTFSHQKSVLKQTTLFDIPFRYPNVRNGLKKLKFFLK